MGNGVRQGLNYKEFSKLMLLNPSLPEQQAIADYLDAKCTDIDALQQDLQAEIETLQAYKNSLITRAVTQGLDSHVEMKDSGVEYLNHIPKHWKLLHLRYLCSIQTGNQDTQDADPEGDYNFYVRSPIVEKSNRYTFEGDGILMAGDGAGAGRVFHHAYGKYAVHQRVYRISNYRGIISDYLYYYLSNIFPNVMDMGSAQSTVPSVRLPMLLNLYVCLPSKKEQQAIANYLDNKCTKIDSIIASKQKQSEILSDYKKSLIYEMVTGKKEVPVHE